MNSFYSRDELMLLGLKAVGENVLVSRKPSIYNPGDIELKNSIHIDDYCILSGKINIRSFVHISAYTALYGANGIYIDDYSSLPPRCTVFSATDDFIANFLVEPMVKPAARNVIQGPVTIMKYSQIGAGCVIMPNLTIEEGVAVGAMSLVNKSLAAWSIYAGIPVKYIKKRSKLLIIYL